MNQLIDAYKGLIPEHKNGDISLLYLDLVQTYRQKHRYYHNLSHLEYIFKTLTSNTDYLRLTTEESNTLLWAMFYHDYVYDPFAKDNEQRSAEKAVQILRYLGINEITCTQVTELILATARHDEDFKPKNLITAILLDADLSIFGGTCELYKQYAHQIRKEYANVPEELFRAGRKKILERILMKRHIYYLDSFREAFEKQARNNIANEIQSL